MKSQEDTSKNLNDLLLIFIIPVLTFLSLDFGGWDVLLRCQYLMQRHLLKQAFSNPAGSGSASYCFFRNIKVKFDSQIEFQALFCLVLP